MDILKLSDDHMVEINTNQVNEIKKKLNKKRKINNLSAEKCLYDDKKKCILGKGKFSTVFLHSTNPNLIIRDTKIYHKISKKINENCEAKNIFLDEHDNEIEKIVVFTNYVIKKFPLNFIKYYSFQSNCVTENNKMFNSEDSNDDEYLINQMVLDRVHGTTLNKFKFDNDDFKMIYDQLNYLIINLNMSGCFHNDLKENNIMIELRYDINELNLNKINSLEILKLEKKIIKKKKLYFPLVKLVDYSLSYVSNDIKKIYFPIELKDLEKIYNNLLRKYEEKYTLIKLKKLNSKLPDKLDLIFNGRVNSENIDQLITNNENIFESVKVFLDK